MQTTLERKIVAKAYRESEKGRAARAKANKRFWLSEKGKAGQRRNFKKYNATIKGHLQYVYRDIRKRCDNPKHEFYYRYGGRGIQCLFFSKEEFINYVIDELQIDPRELDCDRIDNDGNYEPGNIRFVTHQENCQNRGRKSWARI